ncbi:MAG TPA: glycosyltransferase family 4 protein [Rhizomicrobium sp.]|nr:glycosyltransferase family 4 protein [Rhizomicrobium sp.]
MPSVVIVVENLPVPFDRRVWQEARALKAAGWSVSVICPTSERHCGLYEELDGIAIYRHRLPLEARGKFAFIAEYGAALFHEFRLLLRVARERGFDVIQGCNPPDLIFLPALWFKLSGKRYVFDHHDVCPELLSVKFGRKGLLYHLLLLLERLSFGCADLIVTANDTFRDIAIERGGQHPDKVITVYSVPDESRLRRVPVPPGIRSDGEIILGYVGIIGDQDGVDHLIRAMHHLTTDLGARDVRAIVVGDGPALASVKALARELGVDRHITFTGYRSGDDLLGFLSAFDIGVIPDPVNEYNDKISMNKVFEYSALGIPSIAYPLTETMRLLGDAGCYAAGNRPEQLAEACDLLLRSSEERRRRGLKAKALADANFSWEREAERYVGAYGRLLASRSAASIA